STRTVLGTGSAHSSRPALVATSRSGAPRSRTAFAARTGVGPPPRATGTRYDKAPRSTWAPKPAARNGVSQPNTSWTRDQEEAAPMPAPRVTRVTTSQVSPARTDQAGNVVGGLRRRASTNAGAVSSSPVTY